MALILSVSQACMIQVSLADRVHEVRFLLGKIISPLLEHNSKGSKPVEGAFECVFIDENLAMMKSCSSVLHDNVVSATVLNVLIVLHVAPLIAFGYILFRYLVEGHTEHLFLYVENLEQKFDEHIAHPSVKYNDGIYPIRYV
ncbi:unnamed protein product [Dracunculus medinensis]|uniref:Uncharacterized protein n=1 Tax=Dracunculus medinensis TaxID=318479 RepID=A0A3P7P9S4_DRAME|nr:unnamed protein product [Dracunculus medinensis]